VSSRCTVLCRKLNQLCDCIKPMCYLLIAHKLINLCTVLLGSENTIAAVASVLLLIVCQYVCVVGGVHSLDSFCTASPMTVVCIVVRLLLCMPVAWHCCVYTAGILVFAAMFGTLFHANSTLQRLIAQRVSYTCWLYCHRLSDLHATICHHALLTCRHTQMHYLPSNHLLH